VEEFETDGQVRPPLLTDELRWQRMIFTSQDALTIQEMNGLFSTYATITNTQHNSLSLKPINSSATSSPWWSEWGTGQYHPPAAERSIGYTDLSYTRPQSDAMILEGTMNGRRLRVTLKKEDRQFVLRTRRFQWINDEYDFFSEHVDRINATR
jgi:hypothetical protein